MTNETSRFWEFFSQKNLSEAQVQFDMLADNDKQAVLAELFQKSEYHRKPVMVSVLQRHLHDQKTYDDFYQAWLPPEEMTKKIETAGQVFQQGFPVPVRVINGVNMNDPTDIISVGITWVSSEAEEKALWEKIQEMTAGEDETNQKRHDTIAEVSDGKLIGLFRVETDDNLGVPF